MFCPLLLAMISGVWKLHNDLFPDLSGRGHLSDGKYGTCCIPAGLPLEIKYRRFSVAILGLPNSYLLKLLSCPRGNMALAAPWVPSSSASGNKGLAQGKVAKSNLISGTLLGSLPSMQTCCAPDQLRKNMEKPSVQVRGEFRGPILWKHFGSSLYGAHLNSRNMPLAFQFKVPQLGIHVIVSARPLHQPFASTTSGASG